MKNILIYFIVGLSLVLPSLGFALKFDPALCEVAGGEYREGQTLSEDDLCTCPDGSSINPYYESCETEDLGEDLEDLIEPQPDDLFEEEDPGAFFDRALAPPPPRQVGINRLNPQCMLPRQFVQRRPPPPPESGRCFQPDFACGGPYGPPLPCCSGPLFCPGMEPLESAPHIDRDAQAEASAFSHETQALPAFLSERAPASFAFSGVGAKRSRAEAELLPSNLAQAFLKVDIKRAKIPRHYSNKAEINAFYQNLRQGPRKHFSERFFRYDPARYQELLGQWPEFRATVFGETFAYRDASGLTIDQLVRQNPDQTYSLSITAEFFNKCVRDQQDIVGMKALGIAMSMAVKKYEIVLPRAPHELSAKEKREEFAKLVSLVEDSRTKTFFEESPFLWSRGAFHRDDTGTRLTEEIVGPVRLRARTRRRHAFGVVWEDDNKREGLLKNGKAIRAYKQLARHDWDGDQVVFNDATLYEKMMWRNNHYSCGHFYPTFLLSFIRHLFEAGHLERSDNLRLLDTSAGWADRMLASIAGPVGTYFGVDPNSALAPAYHRVAQEYVALYNQIKRDAGSHARKDVQRFRVETSGSELDGFARMVTENWGNEFKFDIAFTSPPYFNMEQYCQEKSQSFKRFRCYYPDEEMARRAEAHLAAHSPAASRCLPAYVTKWTVESFRLGWLNGFFKKTVDNTLSVLRDGGILAYNIPETIYNRRKAPFPVMDDIRSHIEAHPTHVCEFLGKIATNQDYIVFWKVHKRGIGQSIDDEEDESQRGPPEGTDSFSMTALPLPLPPPPGMPFHPFLPPPPPVEAIPQQALLEFPRGGDPIKSLGIGAIRVAVGGVLRI